ncbi:MAG: hypothetical protein WDN75_19060 [Bacteroidota bacterium]
MAEGLLSYAGSKLPETLQEGQGWSAKYGFTNISPRAFTDSLVVQVDIFSGDKNSSQRSSFRIKAAGTGRYVKIFCCGDTKD